MDRAFKPALAYHVLTPAYDSATAMLGFGDRFQRRVLAAADVPAGGRLLDLGCGTGRLLSLAAQHSPSAHLVGVDPDPRMLARAERRLRPWAPRVELRQAFAQNVPYDDESFDLILSTLTFHHLSTLAKRRAMAESYRLLRSDGRFVLADFGKPASRTRGLLLSLLSVFDGRANMRANLGGRLPHLLTDAGFNVKTYPRGYGPIQILDAQRRPLSS